MLCQLVFGRIVENEDIAFSTSASLEPSYVLRALGAEEDMAHSSIRSCLEITIVATDKHFIFTFYALKNIT